MNIYIPTPTQLIYASRAGVPTINPASPTSGGAASTRLQQILNLASSGSTHLKLILDVPCRAQQLLVYGGTTIEGVGPPSGASPATGIWQDALSSTNSCILRNAHWASNYQASTSGTANIVDQDIVVRNLHLDGQRRDGSSGNASFPVQNASGYICSPIQMYGVANLQLHGLNVYDPNCYHIHVANINYGIFRDLNFLDPVFFASQPSTRETDGLHINGPSNDLTIDGLTGTTGDDFLALNAADGHLGEGTFNGYSSSIIFGGGYSAVYYGDILRVVANKLLPNTSLSGVRTLVGTDPRGGGPSCTMDDIVISGLCGSITNTSFMSASLSYLSLTNSLKQRIILRDWILDPVGTRGGGYEIGGNFRQIEILNHRWSNVGTANQHQVNLASDASGGTLVVDKRIHEISGAEVSPLWSVLISQGVVDVLEVSGEWFRLVQEANYPVLISGGTVNVLRVRDFNTNNVAGIASITGGTVGQVDSSNICCRNAGGNPSYNIGTGVTVPRFRACGSDTALLTGGAGTITSKKTDGTEDS